MCTHKEWAGKREEEKIPYAATIQNEGKGYSPKLKGPKCNNVLSGFNYPAPQMTMRYGHGGTVET
jgi:hypothetical protein